MTRQKIEIIPAILPMDFNDLEDKVLLISSLVKSIQIDVCDGQFTPSPSWPYKKSDETFRKLISEEMGLPSWESLNFEIDLMVNKPGQVVDEWISAGANRIIIHVESGLKETERPALIADAVTKLMGRAEIGLALNVETDIETISPYKDQIQFVQCMGIDRIGFQGQTFDNKVIDKIKKIKAAFPDLIVSVDGGVSLDNAEALIDAGASRLVIGSAIFESDNPIEAVQRFKKIATSTL
ncbi:MAG: hypothetical protein WCT02_03140 [Candidatus Paceibacterota bacterium]